MSSSSSSLQSHLKQLLNSPFYLQSLQFKLKHQIVQKINISLKSHNSSSSGSSSNDQHNLNQFILKTPNLKFVINQEIMKKLENDISKCRKNKNGLLLYSNKIDERGDQNIGEKDIRGEKNNVPHMHKLHYFTSPDQDDIGIWQQAQDSFCVGFAIIKENSSQSYSELIKRITTQVKKCAQRKYQIVYTKNNKILQTNSELNIFQKLLYKNFRIFLVYQNQQSSQQSNIKFKTTQLMYYPNVKFCIKNVKIVPSKFTLNKVYEEVLQFNQKYDYGYLSLSNHQKTKQTRFLLIDKFDPNLNQNPPPIIGFWLAVQRCESKQEMKVYFWAVIMEYLRNPSLKVKLSVNFPNTGIIFTIQKPHKITPYIFQILLPTSGSGQGNSGQSSSSLKQFSWNFKLQKVSEHLNRFSNFYNNQSMKWKIPQQYFISMNGQQIIFEEEKQESDIQSVRNMKTSGQWANNNSCSSSESQTLQSQRPPNMLKSNSHVEYQSTSYPASRSNNNFPYLNGDLSKSTVFLTNQQPIISPALLQEKQLQIKFLKKQLQFYKNRCQILQKMVNSPNLMMQWSMNNLNQQVPIIPMPMYQQNNGIMMGQISQMGQIYGSTTTLNNTNLITSTTNPQLNQQKLQSPIVLNPASKPIEKFDYQDKQILKKSLKNQQKQNKDKNLTAISKNQSSLINKNNIITNIKNNLLQPYEKQQQNYRTSTEIKQINNGQNIKKNDSMQKNYKNTNNISFASQQYYNTNDNNNKNQYEQELQQQQQSGFFGNRSPEFKRYAFKNFKYEDQAEEQQNQCYDDQYQSANFRNSNNEKNGNMNDNNKNKMNSNNNKFQHQFSFDKKDNEFLISSFGNKEKQRQMITQRQRQKQKQRQKEKERQIQRQKQKQRNKEKQKQKQRSNNSNSNYKYQKSIYSPSNNSNLSPNNIVQSKLQENNVLIHKLQYKNKEFSQNLIKEKEREKQKERQIQKQKDNYNRQNNINLSKLQQKYSNNITTKNNINETKKNLDINNQKLGTTQNNKSNNNNNYNKKPQNSKISVDQSSSDQQIKNIRLKYTTNNLKK